MKQFIAFLLITLFTSIASAKSKVEVEIELMTSDLIGEVILDKEPFYAYLKLLKADIEAAMANEKGNKDLAVVITIHSNKQATIIMGARPALKASNYSALEKKMATHVSPQTKFSEYSLMFRVTINEGCGCEDRFTPDLVMPYTAKMINFNSLSLVDKQAEIQQWIKSDVLPLIVHYESNVDTVYLGVLAMGSELNNHAYLGKEVKNLTDFNPNYWRATMEMSLGNQLIPFTKVCLLLANGQFDEANRLLYVINFFYDDKTLPAKFDREINDKLQSFFDQLGIEIQKGIALHDKGKYAEAMEHYDTLLKNFPNSAWLNYEMYFSRSAISGDLDVSGEDWKDAQKTIYACDPMYPINPQAKSGKEGYLLFRRREISDLFSSAESVRADIVTYADIALDLENYSFAGQIYWLVFSHLKEEDFAERNILAHYLYCLDKLGDTSNIENFDGDYQAEFAQIEAERIALMKNSEMYKAFSKEE